MNLAPIYWQCRNEECLSINNEKDVFSLPCFYELVANTLSTYKIRFPCKSCGKYIVTELDNNYPTLSQMLLGIAKVMNEIHTDAIIENNEYEKFSEKMIAEQEKDQLIAKINELRCRKSDIDSDNEKIESAVEKIINKIGEDRINKLEEKSLIFLKGSMFKTALLQRFVKKEFMEKFLSEWGSLAIEMTKVYEVELKKRLSCYINFMFFDKKDKKYKKPSLGILLKTLKNYKKLNEEEKNLIDKCTSIHKNNELLDMLFFVNNNFRNIGAHDDHFSFSNLKKLYRYTFDEPEKLLIQFIDNIDSAA